MTDLQNTDNIGMFLSDKESVGGYFISTMESIATFWGMSKK